MSNRQFIGMIKSYNSGNGYGFVECAETFAIYGRDIFLHRTEYEACGVDVGSQVRFTIVLSEKAQPRAVNVGRHSGPPVQTTVNAGNLHSMQANMRGELGMGMPIKRPAPGVGRDGRLFGQIRTFNQEKGFGFIQSDQSLRMYGVADVFLHYTAAINFRVGDFVTFEVATGESGKPQAKNLIKSDQQAPPPLISRPPPPRPPVMMQGPRGGEFNMQKEYSGVIKSYNPEKGYGFIDCEEVKRHFGRDVFLSKGEVDRWGLEVGEDVTFIVKLEKGNPQADVVGKTQQMLQRGESQLEACTMGPHLGIIKSYNDGKGFGFIQCPETEQAFGCDVFLHKREMDESHQVGKEVQFCIILNNRGKPQATDVHVIGEGLTEVEPALKKQKMLA